MTIYAILLPDAAPAPLVERIATTFPNNYFQISDSQWLISATGTAQEISNVLGITSGTPAAGIVFATSGYFGRAPTDIWEWIKAKLETPPTNIGTGTQNVSGSAP